MMWGYRIKASIIPLKQNPFSWYFWACSLLNSFLFSPLWQPLSSLLCVLWPGHYSPARAGDEWAGGNHGHRWYQGTSTWYPGHQIQPADRETYFQDMCLWQNRTTNEAYHLLNPHILVTRLLTSLRA